MEVIRNQAIRFLANLKQEVIELEDEILLEDWFNLFFPLENQIIDEVEESNP